MKDIVNPHDKLFKEMQSVIENSRDLIESVFPGEILNNLNLDTLANDNNSYVDPDLREYYSDLVFTCMYNNSTEIKISILFEHKSYKPENEYLQLLQYILNIWNYAVKNNETPPVVIPMIYYHGKQEWKLKPLYSHFSGIDNNLKQFIPDFKYILANITETPDKEIVEKFNSGINKVLALLLKHISDEEYIKRQFKYLFSLLLDYFGEEKRSAVITFLIYIMSTTEIDKEHINNCLKEISPQGGNIAMTTAMKIKQEGIEQGLEQGELQKQRDVLIRLITRKFGISKENKQFIESVTNTVKLDNALDEIITAETVSEVLSKLE